MITNKLSGLTLNYFSMSHSSKISLDSFITKMKETEKDCRTFWTTTMVLRIRKPASNPLANTQE